jgi:hypothetical protein
VKTLLVLVSVALTAVAFGSDSYPGFSGADFAAFPRAYVGLASAGIAAGYHGWTNGSRGDSFAWWDANGSLIEGSYFVTQRFGLGLRVLDGAICPVDTSLYTVMFSTFAPTFSLVTNSGSRAFGYLSLEVMPYMPDSNVVSSAIALDYGLVPFAPWPIEGRVRVAAMVFNWKIGELAYYASAGVRVGLGYWFMRKPSQVRM